MWRELMAEKAPIVGRDGGAMYKELRVIELVRAGLTDNAALAERLGLATNTVRHYRHKHGLSNQRGPELHNARAKDWGFPDYPTAIRAWAADGLTNEAIGARLGVWASQVSLYIRRMGGVIRPAGRGRVPPDKVTAKT